MCPTLRSNEKRLKDIFMPDMVMKELGVWDMNLQWFNGGILSLARI